ncbi:MAG: DNA recombination protein RmuC [Endomicrobiia bacterium]
MEVLIIILLVFIVSLLVFNIISLKKSQDEKSLSLMQQQIDSLRMQVSENLQATTQAVNTQLATIIDQVNKQLNNMNQNLGTRLDNAAKVFGEVQKGLGTVMQATERVYEIGKDISTLQEILRAPKLRGTLGELFLGDLLSQILPSQHYTLQYKFKSGETVDAVIHIGQGIVPVDSKFPLENFKRIVEANTEDEKKQARKKFILDVKKHIDDISKKYILPDEGTFDFALMYIPAENVYYETIIKDDSLEEKTISSYALEKRVIPVSPNSFYAYLQVIVLGLKGMKIEKNALTILEHLERLKGDFARFRDDFETLGKHISSAKSKYDDSEKKLTRLEEKLLSSGESIEIPSLKEAK